MDPAPHDFRAKKADSASTFARLPYRLDHLDNVSPHHPRFFQPRGLQENLFKDFSESERHHHENCKSRKAGRLKLDGRKYQARRERRKSRPAWPWNRARPQLRADRCHPRITTAPADRALHRRNSHGIEVHSRIDRRLREHFLRRQDSSSVLVADLREFTATETIAARKIVDKAMRSISKT